MPCYEPPLPHETRLSEFLTAALCYATAKMTPEDLASFPGLAEWRRRHAAIDAAETPYRGASDYDRAQGRGGYHGPLFMDQFMEAFPTNGAGGHGESKEPHYTRGGSGGISASESPARAMLGRRR